MQKLGTVQLFAQMASQVAEMKLVVSKTALFLLYLAWKQFFKR